jgi:hypothetical protein
MESPGKSLPRSGHVSALARGWAVQEDLALAERMQQVEVARHYGGNRDRNRQIREDIPQAREVQGQEEVRLQREEEERRQRMDRLATEDAGLAQVLAGGRKDSYVARRDQAFSRNLQRIEAQYRERQAREKEEEEQPYHTERQGEEQSYHRERQGGEEQPYHSEKQAREKGGEEQPKIRERQPGGEDQPYSRERQTRERDEKGDMSYHDLGGGLQYQDEQYLVEVARPVQLTEEPLYMNERREVGEADLWGTGPAFHLGTAGSWTRGREREEESLRTRLEARGFLEQGEGSSHNTSTETAGTVTTFSSAASTQGSELGACGGAAVRPEDFLGPRSLLSPEELRGAEAAEREFEQERRDEELARRLQDELAEGEDNEAGDQRVAREAQDREFARVLQAREQARARRAKEKARQRKQERQREREEAIATVEEPVTEQLDATRSPRSPDIKPPSRRPHMRATAIDSHTNDTYCKTQITPEHSDDEPRYANIGADGQPVAEEPILHVPTSREVDG